MGLFLGWLITIIIEILIISGFASGGADNAASIIALLFLCTVVVIPIIKITKVKIEEYNSNYKTSNQINTSNKSERTYTQVNTSNKSDQTTTPVRRNYFTKVVGVTMNDDGKSDLNGARQSLIKKLNVGDMLSLKHEVSNSYDENAIGVFNYENKKLGYISKSINVEILKELANNNIKDVKVKNITGGYSNKAYGLNIEINYNDSLDEKLNLTNSWVQKNNKKIYSQSTYDNEYEEHDLLQEVEINARQEALFELFREKEMMNTYDDASSDLRHEVDFIDYDSYEDNDLYDDYDSYDDYDPF